MENDHGFTCLHVAAHNSHRSIVQYILAEAGDEFARQPVRSGPMSGKTAMAMARGEGFVGTTCSCCAPFSTQQAVYKDLLAAELRGAQDGPAPRCDADGRPCPALP